MNLTWAKFARENGNSRWELISMTDHDEIVSEWQDSITYEMEEAAENNSESRWQYAIVPVDGFIWP